MECLVQLSWKLRRVGAGLRQQDVAAQAGMSTTRYSLIERGDVSPSEADRNFIERALPALPTEVREELLLAPSV